MNFGVLTAVLMKVQVFLVCFFLSSVLQFPTFRRIIFLPSSGLGSVTPKTYHETGISMLIIFTYYSCVCKVDCSMQ